MMIVYVAANFPKQTREAHYLKKYTDKSGDFIVFTQFNTSHIVLKFQVTENTIPVNSFWESSSGSAKIMLY